MVYLSTSEEWQRQSSLLLQARPTTTRITTKYHIPNLESPKYQNARKRKIQDQSAEAGDPTAQLLPRGSIVLKTYDPESGACLKFKTDRAADVGRLINGLGRVGRYMAALPEKPDAPEVPMEEAPATRTSAEATGKDGTVTNAAATGGGDASGKRKKKKGKK